MAWGSSLALVGSLLAGSLLGAGVGYVAVASGALPLVMQGGVGLGIALGGGLGVVSNLLAVDARDDGVDGTGSVTVDMETDESPSPRPRDLFDGHPDPVLYVADQGHGPVVLAANPAFAETFDVPADPLDGTPLAEALMATDAQAVTPSEVADAIADDDPVDTVLTCQTPGGETTFRVRSVGGGDDGYVIYSPTDGTA